MTQFVETLHRVWVSHGPRDTWRGSIGAKCCKSCQFVTIFISPGYSLPLYCNPAVTLPIMLCWLIRIDRDPIFDWQISLQLISVRICILHHIGYSVATLCVCTKDVINRTANWHFHILTVKYFTEFANVVYKAGCSFFCRCNNKSTSHHHYLSDTCPAAWARLQLSPLPWVINNCRPTGRVIIFWKRSFFIISIFKASSFESSAN